jgi:hypothetical protein
VTSTLAPIVETTGRHRLGLPGLRPLSSFASIVTRGFLARLFYRGRHREPVPARTAPTATAARAAV